MNFSYFSVRGCWGQLMSFFWKLVNETQISAPPEATRHHKSKKMLVLLSLRANLKIQFRSETPCINVSRYEFEMKSWRRLLHRCQQTQVPKINISKKPKMIIRRIVTSLSYGICQASRWDFFNCFPYLAFYLQKTTASAKQQARIVYLPYFLI